MTLNHITGERYNVSYIPTFFLIPAEKENSLTIGQRKKEFS